MTTPVISIRQGKLRGVVKHAEYSKKKYYSFLGIPYAKPPIGNRRFQAPEPADNWNDVFDANTEGNDCSQFSFLHMEYVGSEDCLYLNVHIPEFPSEDMKLKPVIFSIHCGGNNWGSGSENCLGSPDYLMHQDVIYVPINYRLHVFGFLNLGIRECRGNAGMKDIVLALKWVKENIRAFGGDPDNVTAIGNSSAASMVHLLLLSPLSKAQCSVTIATESAYTPIVGLVNKAIIQGCYGMDLQGAIQLDTLETAFKLGKLLGYPGGNNPRKLYYFLKKKSAIDLLHTNNALRHQEMKEYVGGFRHHSFTVSIEAIPDGAFLSQSPFEMADMVDRIPMIVGLCEDEGAYSLAINPVSYLTDNFKTAVQRTFCTIEMDENLLTDVTEKLKQFYFQDRTIDGNVQQEIINFYTDAWKSLIYRLLIDVVSPEAPVFVYNFNYIGSLNFGSSLIRRAPKKLTNAAHSDDLYYWTASCPSSCLNSSDKEIIDRMTTYICNFAKTGNPNSDAVTEWVPTTVHKQCYLQFSIPTKMVDGRIHDARFKFWEELSDYIESRIQEGRNFSK